MENTLQNYINKQYLLTTIFPYYMIPHKMWDERMKTLALAGFNCISVCFAWNYHEIIENEWLFEDGRDIERLLKLAKKNKLFVIARPGLFVELIWDGAAVPAYLVPKTDSTMRSASNIYHEYSPNWYDRILPILKKYEYSEHSKISGPIIGLEIESMSGELAMLNISSISKHIKKYNFSVPVVYREINIPYNINVQNSHCSLKQQLIKGQKILNAKNFVGGCQFNFYNTIKNYENGGAFVSSAIGENSIISPFGEINKAEFTGMRLFRMFIDTFGIELYNGKNINNPGFSVIGKNSSKIETDIYKLNETGYIIACTNNASTQAEFVLSEKNNSFPKKTSITVNPLTSRYILKEYSFAKFGLNVFFEYCTAEIFCCKKIGTMFFIMLFLENEFEFCISGENISDVKGNMSYFITPEAKSITAYFKGESELKINVNGQKIRITALSKETASNISSIDNTGVMNCIEVGNNSSPSVISSRALNIYVSDVNLELEYKDIGDNAAKYLEKNGIYQGYAMYEADAVLPESSSGENILGVVVNRAADVMSLYINDKYITTEAPFGTHTLIETYSTEMQIIGDNIMEVPVMKVPVMKAAKNTGGINKIRIKSEIWGHTFGEFGTTPSLRFCSMKGIRGISVVTRKTEITPKCKISPQTNRSFGIYSKSNAKIRVNGKNVSELKDNYQYADITPYIRSKMDNEIEITGENLSSIYLIEGIKAQKYKLAEINIQSFTDAYKKSGEILKTTLPFEFKAGTDRFITFELNKAVFPSNVSFKAVVAGKGIKITALLNDNVTGRLWLPDEYENAPKMLFGVANTVYIPSSLLINGNNMLTFYVEPISNKGRCVLESVEFISI